jgi:hypothetical protein
MLAYTFHRMDSLSSVPREWNRAIKGGDQRCQETNRVIVFLSQRQLGRAQVRIGWRHRRQ